MPRIITALFRDQGKAQQALQALIETGVARDRVTTAGLDEGREVSSISGFRDLSLPDETRAALQRLELPAGDMRLFEQGLRRGCALVAARVDRENMEEAVRVLEMFEPMDLDRHSREWAQSGGQGGADAGAPLAAGISGGNADGLSNTGSVPGMGTLTGDNSTLGTADLRTGETGAGAAGSTVPTGPSSGRREDLPGVNELGRESVRQEPDTGMLKRESNRGGPVWSYGTD